jgi:hypothetical protein
LHQETGLVALANLPQPGKVVSRKGMRPRSATKRSRESQPSQLEGFSMSAKILNFQQAKKRQLMRAKYAALMLTEMLLADEAEALVADPEVQEDLAPKQPER